MKGIGIGIDNFFRKGIGIGIGIEFQFQKGIGIGIGIDQKEFVPYLMMFIHIGYVRAKIKEI